MDQKPAERTETRPEELFVLLFLLRDLLDVKLAARLSVIKSCLNSEAGLLLLSRCAVTQFSIHLSSSPLPTRLRIKPFLQI